MARIIKTGLDYFPVDVTFLNGRKMRRLIRKYGPVTVAVIIAAYSAIYSEKGYYLEWNEDVCFDLSERANTEFEKVQTIIADAMRMELFDAEMFKQHGILTSESIQKQYVQCTLKRKSVEWNEKYNLLPQKEPISSSKYSSAVPTAPQTQLGGEETSVCGTEMQQRKEKEIESKAKEKEQQTTPTPPKTEGQEGGGKEDLVLIAGRRVPEYCLNKRTHNYDGLLERLNQIHVTDMKEVNKILDKSDYGMIGHPLWGIISHTNWPKFGIKFPGKYILSQLKAVGS